MNNHQVGRVALVLSTVIAIGLLAGCEAPERVTTHDVTTTGKNWVETESTQRYRAPSGKVTVEKQSIYEKINCIGRRGKKIDAATSEECIQRGGKIVDEVYIEEESTRTSK